MKAGSVRGIVCTNMETVHLGGVAGLGKMAGHCRAKVAAQRCEEEQRLNDDHHGCRYPLTSYDVEHVTARIHKCGKLPCTGLQSNTCPLLPLHQTILMIMRRPWTTNAD